MWTTGNVDRFAVGLQRPATSPRILTLGGVVAARLGTTQALSLEIGGHLLERWERPAGPALLGVALPADEAQGLVLTLRVSRPIRPPGGRDHRSLGFFLQSIAGSEGRGR